MVKHLLTENQAWKFMLIYFKTKKEDPLNHKDELESYCSQTLCGMVVHLHCVVWCVLRCTFFS